MMAAARGEALRAERRATPEMRDITQAREWQRSAVLRALLPWAGRPRLPVPASPLVRVVRRVRAAYQPEEDHPVEAALAREAPAASQKAPSGRRLSWTRLQEDHPPSSIRTSFTCSARYPKARARVVP
jgi:hypothetical protein